MSPRWRRPFRAVRRVTRYATRHATRRATRRAIRRQRRFIRRRTRRFLIGGAILLALAGTTNSYKMRERDVERLENHYGRPVEELTEEEIVSGMRQLGIQKIELNSDDEAIIYAADEEEEKLYSKTRFCSNCGEPLEQDALFCSSCGAKV